MTKYTCELCGDEIPRKEAIYVGVFRRRVWDLCMGCSTKWARSRDAAIESVWAGLLHPEKGNRDSTARQMKNARVYVPKVGEEE